MLKYCIYLNMNADFNLNISYLFERTVYMQLIVLVWGGVFYGAFWKQHHV